MGLINRIKKLKKNKKYKNSDFPEFFFTENTFNNKENTSIGSYTYGKPEILFHNNGAKIQIGNFCSIADGVKIYLGGNHRMDWVSTYPFNVIFRNHEKIKSIKGHPSTKGDVIIGNDVWLGGDCVILSGITIGNGAVIAANSVVTKDVAPFEVWGGNPAKFLKKRFNEETINSILSSFIDSMFLRRVLE